VKYIRYLVDNHFAHEPMDDTSKLLFACAAYNAEAGRIHALRVEAAAQGLDPNVWIDNVEMIAAARIGMETVTYVANIDRYYIAYKLIALQEDDKKKTRESLGNGP
jgi:membrane-bound lytic murein transglycosylase MltF